MHGNEAPKPMENIKDFYGLKLCIAQEIWTQSSDIWSSMFVLELSSRKRAVQVTEDGTALIPCLNL